MLYEGRCPLDCYADNPVLILILMEYALWVNNNQNVNVNEQQSLNPYSNGICSMSIAEDHNKHNECES